MFLRLFLTSINSKTEKNEVLDFSKEIEKIELTDLYRYGGGRPESNCTDGLIGWAIAETHHISAKNAMQRSQIARAIC